MCQTLHEASRMQQQQRDSSLADGDLGAIVRSAKPRVASPPTAAAAAAAVAPPPPPPPPVPQIRFQRSSPPSPPSTASPAAATGGFMELIGSSSSSGSSSTFAVAPPPVMDFRASFLDSASIVKREPMDNIPELMHEIFSSSRAMPCSFIDDIKDIGFIHDIHHRQQQQQQPQQQKQQQQQQQQPIPQPGDLGALGRLDLGTDAPAQAKDDNPSEKSSGKTKRSRKMQQKRIVCVPVAGGGKPSGEVLPSDMWAWRKYGQKPIKGSPYPRGYYRCSSSKGCSARKQVERSRNDPSMLVITYTSEHNHPWPAHRNSLAGTTRIRPMAAAAAAATSSAAAASSADEPRALEQQQQQQQQSLQLNPADPFVPIVCDPLQQQRRQQEQQQQQQPHQLQMLDEEAYTPLLLQRTAADIASLDLPSRSSSQDEDFFSELEELPELSSILDKSFLAAGDDGGGGGPGGGAFVVGGGGASSGDAASGGGARRRGGGGDGVDPFSLFSWSQQRPH